MPLTARPASRLGAAILAVLSAAPAARAAGTLSVQPPSSSVLPGHSFTLAVELSGVADAYAFQFDVTFDPSLLKLTSIANGGFLPDDNFSAGITRAAGSVTFVYDLLTGPVPGVSGGGHLAVLTFETFDDRFGSSTVALGNVILIDSKGADIPLAGVTGATVDYLDEIAPVTVATATPPANANGWNASDVVVDLHASDSGSGVKEIDYRLSGAASGSNVVAGDAAHVTIAEEGVSTLNVHAVDTAGNQEAPHDVMVRVDKTPPVLSLPADLTVEATGPGGASVSFSASAHDVQSGDLAVVLDPPAGSQFPLGATTVRASATDLAGNTSTGSFRVSVRDTAGPAVSNLAASPSRIWPPDHKMVPVTIAASVTDAVDPSPTVRIVSVSSNEAAGGTGAGHTGADWAITGPLTLEVRAERSGSGSGRIYTVTVEGRDRFGNASQGTVVITVPHDR